MPRSRRLLPLLALCALAFVPAAAGQSSEERVDAADQYWLGPYFAGLELTGKSAYPAPAFAYGECELPEGEGGCSLPAQVQNWTSCERNPIALDSHPYEVYAVRGGGLAAGYESTAVDIGTGHQTVTVFTNEYELIGAVIPELRTRSQSTPQPLPPPIYPMPVLRELVRVTAVAKRLDGVAAIAGATGLTATEVRLRLRIAELLGPDALAGVPPPTMSVATVERLRQLAFRSQHYPRKAARRLGISLASLQKKLDRVRGLTGFCD